ncbi:GNAT family N-acetyltransferase [Hyphococcus sp. DH-69]|uniref:GNAT family N-acetyltransferase n=1 Tax=Hyphococcus formosus TaxID=3143534 RepID=UPI00398B3931
MTDLANWSARPVPDLPSVSGRFVRIEPAIFPRDAAALFPAICGVGDNDLWTYIPIGPFASPDELSNGMMTVGADWKIHLILNAQTNEPLGTASYMRIREEFGSAEVGCVVFSRKLQRTPGATEAMYLMARYIFEDLGYRRYEWKCDNANEASKRAAFRLGFQFEGIFRQDQIMKGRNRDTAWFSMIDSEWPAIAAAFEKWLDPGNFDRDGHQKQTLKDIRARL